MNKAHDPNILSERTTFTAMIIMLVVFATLAARTAWTTSATFDEPGFIVAGTSYHRAHAAEICVTNLRLVPWLLTAPVQLLSPQLPAEVETHPGLITSGDTDLGRAFLADPRNDGTTILRVSRCANIFLGVVLGAVLFLWSRRLYGNAGALISLGLYCLNPVVIANSAVATTDIGTTLAFVFSAGALWWLLHRVSGWSVIICGLAMGGLASAKLSWVLILPVATVLVAIRLCSPTLVEPRVDQVGKSWRWNLLGAGAGVVIIAYATVWMVYGFRFTPGTPLPPDAWSGGSSIFHRALEALRQVRLLPEAYLFDLQTFATTGSGRRAFLWGEYSIEGWWYFFPAVWFLKSPVSFIAVLLLVVARPFVTLPSDPRRHRLRVKSGSDLLPLLALGVIYLMAVMIGRLNIGIRHLLPVYPLLFVLAGSVITIPVRRGIRLAGMLVVLGGSATEAALVHPEYLAYVNVFGGGADRGYQTLADSSYDWGQDLPAFEKWLTARSAAGTGMPVYFSYFGNADLARFKDRVVLLPQYLELRPISVYGLGAGSYVISSTMLQTLLGPLMGPWRPEFENQYQDLTLQMQRLESALRSGGRPAFDALIAQEGTALWQERILLHDHFRFARLCAWLRQRPPSSRITRTLLVYELSDNDVRAATIGPPAELRENYVVKGEKR